MSTLYSTEARATGNGRDGKAYLTDRSAEIDMAIPTEMGGSGEGMNPEQLFAMGYATCFHSALKIVAAEAGADITASSVTARVSLGKEENYFLAAEIDVSMPYIEMTRARKLAQKAHDICPYSRAVQGNISVKISVTED